MLHLLGRGRGAPRRWPSLVLLREAALASGARFRPSQPWLLLLRCALLAAVTLALAEPEMARRARHGVVRLVEPGLYLRDGLGMADSTDASAAARGRPVPAVAGAPSRSAGAPTIGEVPGRSAGASPIAGIVGAAGGSDSLGQRASDPGVPGSPSLAGTRTADLDGDTEVRLLAPGLPVPERATARQATAAARVRAEPDLWSLLAEADATLPAGMSFDVVARPRLAALLGARPRLGRTVVWHSPAAETGGPLREVAAAAGAPVLQGEGDRAAATGAARGAAGSRGAAGPRGADGRDGVAGRDGVTGLGGAAGRGQKVRLWIEATPERAGDAVTLRQGLAQGAAALGWAVEEAVAAAAADLVASLGREAPAAWMASVERGATVLRDGGGDLTACVSLVAIEGGGLFERTLCGAEPAGQAVWRDGAGRTVLASERPAGHPAHGDAASRGAVLRYAGRFSPAGGAWGRGAFAALLRQARPAGDAPRGALPPEAAAAETSVEQALPERAAATPGRGSRQPLSAPLWLLAGVLFAAERWLAGRHTRATAAGDA